MRQFPAPSLVAGVVGRAGVGGVDRLPDRDGRFHLAVCSRLSFNSVAFASDALLGIDVDPVD